MTRYAAIGLPALFTEKFEKLCQFDKDLVKTLDEWQSIIKSILDGGLSFDDNADVSRVSVTSHGTPGTEFSVAHLLGKVPAGYIVTGQAGAGSIYDGTTSNTATTAYFKSDVASISFRLMFF